mgnify:CR=1 FL=1
MPSRFLPVPDSLEGTRVDQALAKMLGFSRTFAADVADAGGVVADGRTLGKSDRLSAGGMIEVTWTEKTDPQVSPVIVPDFENVYDDDDIAVISKPVGVCIQLLAARIPANPFW